MTVQTSTDSGPEIAAGAPCRRVLVVADGRTPAATQKISFGQPFDPAHGPAPVQIRFEGASPTGAEIEAAFAAAQPDLLVLSRYTGADGIRWIELARQAGIAVIYHIDDDLLAVPTSLGQDKYLTYNAPARLQALRDNINASDLLYVSTPALEQRFRAHEVAVPIVAGSVYCSVDPTHVGALLEPATGPVIGYMGTGGHSADLAMVMPAVCQVMEQIPTLQFEVFGTIQMPKELARFGRRVRHLPPVADYADFIPHLRSLGWWVGLAPLEDNVFNACKADTKWVEYSLSGMATVASDLGVYHRACADGTGILAKGHAAWAQALLRLLQDPEHRLAMVAAAQDKLRQHYSHAALQAQVLEIFEQAETLSAQRSQGAQLTDPQTAGPA